MLESLKNAANTAAIVLAGMLAAAIAYLFHRNKVLEAERNSAKAGEANAKTDGELAVLNNNYADARDNYIRKRDEYEAK